jgi:hypothetical protein
VATRSFHNGRPVELLYLISSSEDEAWWRVRPLFVVGDDFNERFGPNYIPNHIHTQKVRPAA